MDDVRVHNLTSPYHQSAFLQSMRTCKYKKLSECEFQEIMNLWLEAEDTASKKRRVASHLL